MATVSASFAVEAPGIEGLCAAEPVEAQRRLDWLRTYLNQKQEQDTP